MVRVAVIDKEKCRPEDDDVLCYRVCPEVRMKVYAITVEEGEVKPTIVENLCNGCGICVRKCPYDAIDIVNLPEELSGDCSHRYAKNAFKLFRLPTPSAGLVTGLIGKNGTGKTTALKILSGEIKPNLGFYDEPPEWETIIRNFRGSVLQDYFTRFRNRELKVVHKPQYIDKIPQIVKGKVSDILNQVDDRGKSPALTESLELGKLLNREVSVLSGGESQRLAIATAVCREGDVYIFDEPSSYLDVKQRLNVAKAIRTLADDGKTVLVAEHDIAMLDYLSDQVCIIYGNPGVYGIISHPHVVRTGINIYLDGFLPDDNMRFRDEPIRFHVKPPSETWQSESPVFQWDKMRKDYEGFSLTVDEGVIYRGQVIGILGPNGIGKTTFVKLIVGLEQPTEGVSPTRSETNISYKPQYVSAEFKGTVKELLQSVALENFDSGFYKTEILTPFRLQKLYDRKIPELSGGELQKVSVAACLSRVAHLYLFDEPSAFLDVEERLAMARTIRRIVESLGAAAIVIEHDVVVQDFVADRILPFSGVPGVEGHVHQPLGLRDGMNHVLQDLNLTFRRDMASGRPRVNKESSRLDRRQKELKEYYYVPEREEAEN